MSPSTSNTVPCPPWAHDLIDKLRQVEIFLGNIPESLAWRSELLAGINRRAFPGEDALIDDSKAEFLFRRVVQGLVAEKFSYEVIAQMFNERIGYEGGPPYTSAVEVQEAAEGRGRG
jgi:hypothetical protein